MSVVEFDGITRLDIPPERIIARASEAKLTEVVIVGTTEDGETYFASSLASGPEVLWLLAQAQRQLLEISE